MKTRPTIIWAAIACAIALLTPPTRGAGFVPLESPPRFLFIVEKSEATEALRLDLPQTIFDLVYRGANGHLPDGSVFEIWIFGEETTFRGFEPQMLTPNNHLPLASRASAYVRTARSGGKADVGKLVEHIRGASELGWELTIILITAPDTRLAGTRRDAEINGVLEANAEAQRAAGRPFITSIRVQDGVLAASQVSDSAFTMGMPVMPPSQLSTEERERRLADAQKARLEREKPVVAPAIATAAPAPQRRPRDIPDEEREGAIIIKGGPRNTPPLAEPTAAQTAAASVSANPVATPEGAPATPKLVVEPTPQSPVAQSVTAVPTPESRAPAPVSNPAGTPTPATAVEAAPPNATTAVANDAVAVKPPDAVKSPASTPAGSGLTNVVPQTAVTLPPETWMTAGGLFVAGLCFFIVAALLAWVLMRRARGASGPSYITRSIEERRD